MKAIHDFDGAKEQTIILLEARLAELEALQAAGFSVDGQLHATRVLLKRLPNICFCLQCSPSKNRRICAPRRSGRQRLSHEENNRSRC